jgi:predicted TIM-barrel fold metal-dependent hydrolase
MLPRAEIDNLLTAVFEAVDLAAEGLIAEGYEVLLIGKRGGLEGEAHFEPTAEAVEEVSGGRDRGLSPGRASHPSCDTRYQGRFRPYKTPVVALDYTTAEWQTVWKPEAGMSKPYPVTRDRDCAGITRRGYLRAGALSLGVASLPGFFSSAGAAGARGSALAPARGAGYDPAPLADHHQHLFSPALAALLSPSPPAPPGRPFSAADLIPLLDAAGIRRAVVLSTAYSFSKPARKVEHDYERVRMDNDWTGEQVARYPDRLIAFCSVSPVKDYALDELARGAKSPHLRSGLKLHFGNSLVDYHNAAHIKQLQRVFRAANGYRMAIVVHMRPSVEEKMAYGREETRIFLDEILPAASEVPVQIAHLAGDGGYRDPVIDQAAAVFAEAIARDDPRTRRLWFDVATVTTAEAPQPDRATRIVSRMRTLGVQRILFGSDAATKTWTPRKGWETFRKLPLSEAEFRTIAMNVPPYLP